MTSAPFARFGMLATLFGLAGLAGLGITLGGCSPGSGTSASSVGGSMRIVSCSLSCGGGGGGTQISCGLNQVSVNEAIVIDFSHPVDISSVDKTTFQVTDVATGKSPLGTFALVPGQPNRLLFRPLLSFTASGNPVHGFNELHSYQILVRGVNQDSGGSFITSTSGKPNASRMFCTVAASGILDQVAGPPTVTVAVDVVTETDPITGAVLATEERVASGGAFIENVWSESTIRLHFDDVMNPATLVNPVTGESSTLRIAIDPDGNTSDASDQLELFGEYSIVIDELGLSTDVEFVPSGGLPSAGSGVVPRVIVVSMPNSISDLGAHALANFGEVRFVPQKLLFEAVVMPKGGENFVGTELRDTDRTGALWGEGALLRGKAGGSGRLGALVVTAANSPMVLNTDSQVVSGVDVIAEGPQAFPPSAVSSATVEGGLFEFSEVVVEPGAAIEFTGSNPARLFARGRVFVDGGGRVSANGKLPSDELVGAPAGHNSTNLQGGAGGLAGLSGGAGGKGGDRPDDSDASLFAIGGSPNPGALVDGSAGEGVGGVVGAGSGFGGLTWPALPPANAGDVASYFFNYTCTVGMVAGPGGGGGYATAGGASAASIVQKFAYDLEQPGLDSPQTQGSDPGSVGLTALMRTLDPNLGLLIGGAGGGGGGLQYTRSKSNGEYNKPKKLCEGQTGFAVYMPQSGAGGGAGGGAMQVQSGSLALIEGVLEVRGGDGGSSLGGFKSNKPTDQASPGGGGSGGGLLLQAPQLQITPTPGRLDVSGGQGGMGPGGGSASLGGAGGAGLVRLESDVLPAGGLTALSIAPYDPEPGSPSGGVLSSELLSMGSLTQGLTGPEGRSGAQSCWIRPQGNFLILEFAEDDLGDPMHPIYGWDTDVITTLPDSVPFSFRDGSDGDNPFGVAPEVLLGSDLGGATPGVIVVRFQGVRAVQAVENPCAVDLASIGGAINIESLTGWVRHPAELNHYWDALLPDQPLLAAQRRPNMFRYQVIFDGNGASSSLVAGITNLRVGAVPD